MYLPTLALVIGVPSTSAACGRHLLQQEKAFFGFPPGGDTFDQLLSFATFRAAGSRPYGILLEFVHRIVTRAIVLGGFVGKRLTMPTKNASINKKVSRG